MEIHMLIQEEIITSWTNLFQKGIEPINSITQSRGAAMGFNRRPGAVRILAFSLSPSVCFLFQ